MIGAPVEILSGEMMGKRSVVKGLPYSAQAVTETTQTLADGNRIHRSTSAAIYRDSEGRIRREQKLGGMDPLGVAPQDLPTLVFISDPVAGVSYMLDSNTREAHKTPAPGMGMGMRYEYAGVRKIGAGANPSAVNTESLARPTPGWGKRFTSSLTSTVASRLTRCSKFPSITQSSKAAKRGLPPIPVFGIGCPRFALPSDFRGAACSQPAKVVAHATISSLFTIHHRGQTLHYVLQRLRLRT